MTFLVKKLLRLAHVLGVLGIAFSASSPGPVKANEQPVSETVVAMPEEDKSIILNNPGIGWETNNHTRSAEFAAPDSPPSSIAYFKYYLKTFLRGNGMIDLSALSHDLEQSRLAGQQLAFRLMIYGEEEGGDILRAFGVKRGMRYHYDDGGYKGPELWAPDLDAPETLEILERLLRELGKRFDGHPDLSHVDIGYVGLWGEWHNSDTKPRLRMPSIESQRRIIKMHFDAFPNTIKLMQLQDATALRYALDKGAGIRADCLGAPDSTMMKLYPLTLLSARAQEAWQRAPVVFEICFKAGDWETKKWNAEQIFSIALERYHASALNTKSPSIPLSMRPAFDNFLRRAGYRFALRRVSYPSSLIRHKRIQIGTEWENVGVAPCYGSLKILLRLKEIGGASEKVYPTSAEMCSRLPGTFALNLSIPPTVGLPAGKYEIALGVAPPGEKVPRIGLAIKGMQDYWYTFGSILLQ